MDALLGLGLNIFYILVVYLLQFIIGHCNTVVIIIILPTVLIIYYDEMCGEIKYIREEIIIKL